MKYENKSKGELLVYNKDFLNGIEYLVNNFNIYKNDDYNDENAQYEQHISFFRFGGGGPISFGNDGFN